MIEIQLHTFQPATWNEHYEFPSCQELRKILFNYAIMQQRVERGDLWWQWSNISFIINRKCKSGQPLTTTRRPLRTKNISVYSSSPNQLCLKETSWKFNKRTNMVENSKVNLKVRKQWVWLLSNCLLWRQKWILKTTHETMHCALKRWK